MRDHTGKQLVLRHIDGWANDLVDLSRRNRLLYFKHTRSTSLAFRQSAGAVEDRLSRGWRFFLPPPPASGEDPYEPGSPAHDQLDVAMIPERYGPEIERGLKNLAKRAQSEFLDAGLWVLCVGLGALRWVDDDGEVATSPLLLVPVRLEQRGAAKEWMLTTSDDGESTVNPALAVKLEKDFGISIPSLDDLPEPNVGNVLRAVSSAVDDDRWRVEQTAVLTTFTFHKEVIYRDLREHADQIAEHPMVALLAEGPTSQAAEDLSFRPEDESGLDDRHPPEDLACVLDADVTQRQCLLAARDGRSFVMDGPPGTGKSQTITNVIAQLLAEGRTVLFVSEKAAALDVVYKRLADVHLDAFVLALHSHNATRKAVAQELGRAVEERPSARSRFDTRRRAQLQRDREQLSRYAIAMNLQRQPLDSSLHDAIGRVAQLQALPSVPVPEIDTTDLSSAGLAEICGWAGQLGRAWGPVSRRHDFLWRDLRTSGTFGSRDQLLQRTRACRHSLDALETRMQIAREELSLSEPQSPGRSRELLRILELVDRRLPIGAGWLASDEPTMLDAEVRSLSDSLRRIHELEGELDACASSWRDLPEEAEGWFDPLDMKADALSPPLRIVDSATTDTLHTMLAVVAEARATIERLQAPLRVLMTAFEAPPVDMNLARRLVELAGLVGSPTPPEPNWLSVAGANALVDARQHLQPLLEGYRRRRDALTHLFTERALDVDLHALHVRFTDVHTGLSRLSSRYRADKQELASITVAGKATKEVRARLGDAVEWQRSLHELHRAESQYAQQFGPQYWPTNGAVDLAQVERAIDVVESALRLAGSDITHPSLVRQLARGATPDHRLPSSAAGTATELQRLEQLPWAEVLGVSDDVVQTTRLADLAIWLDAAGELLHELALRVAQTGRAAHRSLTLQDCRQLVASRAEQARLAAHAADTRTRLQDALGELRQVIDPERIDAATRWVGEVRATLRGPIRSRTARALLGTDLSSVELRSADTRWRKTVEECLAAFQPAYAAELTEDLDASFDDARDLLDSLAGSIADVDEWDAYARAREALQAAGLDAVVDACVERNVVGHEVPELVERALLQRWVDQQMAAEPAVDPRRSVDRDAILAEFRRLDAELVADAAARVINICAAKRPRSKVGQAGVIYQEAQRQRRHKPVRRLLTEAGEAALQVKPCFMMSPLSVSQFLPPSLHFDVVIFDEASQVREADAICCIYRGDQLIVAGDPKQLPPSDFFQRTTDDEADSDEDEILDFESVLDRCKAQGFTLLPLRWHFRSQHESLITFSNRSFYEGRLHTFPGALAKAGDLGVELFVVDGVYARGGLRDNPVEAEKVVDRILHHRRHHPTMTIGVVTLSVAQQDTIQQVIERRSLAEPELAELVSDDRLDGFFVKNLENVQGDERDLIVLSVGYGPDENRKFTMNFGPMNKQGGERRLNVAITRARRRVEVVCSFRPGEVHTDNPTVLHLRRYLDYADRGLAALALDLEQAEGDVESPFEADVLQAVRSLGYDAVPQVGVAGYRIDIGVRHPREPGSYALGVECDGWSYHSSKVARDRDRLRRQVLEGLGWTMHHIWSTSWFTDREGEVGRLQDAIATALEGGRQPLDPAPPPVQVEVANHDFGARPDWAILYREPYLPHQISGRELTADESRRDVVRHIEEVVRMFGPIHRDHALEVVRRSWNLGRAGSRVRATFNAAERSVLLRGEIELCDGFLAVRGAEVRVRVPRDADTTPRPVHRVPTAELDLAAERLLQDAGTPTSRSSLLEVWRGLFGWRRAGPDIESAFAEVLDRFVERGMVTCSNDEIRLVTPPHSR